jgi:SAM-dependent methyltransferase
MKNKVLFKDLIKGTLKDKTILRILMNNRLRNVQELDGKILDLGSGIIRSSYHNFLKISKNSQIVSVDVSDERKPDIYADLEQKFPFNDKEFDYALCFNLLEHIFDYKNLVGEACRVLKNGGKLIGAVPFLTGVHADPNDYFRYTKSALERIFKASGFEDVQIEALGYGPFVVGYYTISFLIPRFLRPVFMFPAIILDKIIAKLKKIHGKNKYVLIYYFECKK